jgi:hypothetical protein
MGKILATLLRFFDNSSNDSNRRTPVEVITRNAIYYSPKEVLSCRNMVRLILLVVMGSLLSLSLLYVFSHLLGLYLSGTLTLDAPLYLQVMVWGYGLLSLLTNSLLFALGAAHSRRLTELLLKILSPSLVSEAQ